MALLPVSVMVALYSRVIYTLWFIDAESNQRRQVLNRNEVDYLPKISEDFNFGQNKYPKIKPPEQFQALDRSEEHTLNSSHSGESGVGGGGV